MISFRRLSVNDFGVLERAELALDRQGLVLVRAENRDTDAADSNGAGKSTLFDALSWALYGETVTQGRVADVIRRGAKKARVDVEFSDGAHTYRVTRSRTASATTVELATDDEATSKRTGKDTEARIAEVLGLDWLAFRSTVLFGQDDLTRFGDPATSDVQRKAVLKEVLRLDRFDVALKRVRERMKELAEEKRSVQNDLTIATTKAKTAEINLAYTKRQSDEWVDRHESAVDSARASLDALTEPLPVDVQAATDLERLTTLGPQLTARINEEKEAVKVAERTNADAYRAQNETDKARHAAELELRHATEKVKELAAKLAGLAGNVGCPVCKRPFSGSAHVTAHREKMEADHKQAVERETAARAADAKARAAFDEASQAFATAGAALASARGSLNTWTKKADDIRTRLEAARTAQTRINILDERRENARQRLAEVERQQNPHTVSVTRLEADLKAATAAEEQYREAVAAIEQQEAPLLFWEQGFGNRGLPSLAMDAAMPVLTESANRYLGTLAGGDITVRISTERALKDGRARDEIAIVPTIEGFEAVKASGGQRRKITLAVALALADLVAGREGSSVDLLFLDEVLDGLDATGRACVVDLLRHLREVRSSVFVISHDQAVSESFERILTVVKEGGKATLQDGES